MRRGWYSRACQPFTLAKILLSSRLHNHWYLYQPAAVANSLQNYSGWRPRWRRVWILHIQKKKKEWNILAWRWRYASKRYPKLPHSHIQLFYAPWLRSCNRAGRGASCWSRCRNPTPVIEPYHICLIPAIGERQEKTNHLSLSLIRRNPCPGCMCTDLLLNYYLLTDGLWQALAYSESHDGREKRTEFIRSIRISTFGLLFLDDGGLLKTRSKLLQIIPNSFQSFRDYIASEAPCSSAGSRSEDVSVFRLSVPGKWGW